MAGPLHSFHRKPCEAVAVRVSLVAVVGSETAAAAGGEAPARRHPRPRGGGWRATTASCCLSLLARFHGSSSSSNNLRFLFLPQIPRHIRSLLFEFAIVGISSVVQFHPEVLVFFFLISNCLMCNCMEGGTRESLAVELDGIFQRSKMDRQHEFP